MGYLIQKNKQSSTVKSYISMMKSVLKEHFDINLTEDTYLLSALTKACKLQNDTIRTRLPIQKGMLRIIQHQLVIHFRRVNQPYLLLLYQTIFSTMYFGLLRVSEVAQSNDTDHAVKARDVHVGDNKRKFLLVLRMSKTHWKNMKPQLIKIAAKSAKTKQKHSEHNKLLCPYQLLRDFSAVRGGFVTVDEPFFTFADRSPVTPRNVNNCLCTIIKEAGFDASL